jgi:hypothetical protein
MWRGPCPCRCRDVDRIVPGRRQAASSPKEANPLTFRSLAGVGTPPSADSRRSPMPVMPTVLAAIIRDAPFAAYVHIRRPI